MAGLDIPALIDQLTLEEKAALCLGSDFWHTTAVERLGIPAILLSDGPHGLRKQTDAESGSISGSVPATCFPTAAALGSSWDPSLLQQIGDALGREARAENVAVVLGPGINIKRSPLCGRNFEYYSEDPLLAGVLAAALIDGVQAHGVGTSLKHFAANNQEDDRMRVSADVDERTLREIYLAAFEYVVKHAGPWTLMCAYNKLNGVYASQHRWLLTEVLRDEWGFDGLVMSDWGAVHDRVAAVAAGLDLEMPPNKGVSDAAIVAAVRSGELDVDVVDTAVRRVLELVDRAMPGLRTDDEYDAEAHHVLARQAATQCAVLLKNDGAILPLSLEPGSRLAVIGEFARTPRYQGSGSSQVNPTRLDAALDELRAGVPPGVEIDFAPGFSLGDGQDDQALRNEAVEIAAHAFAVVVFLGLPAADESEGFDRTHLDLPASQISLLEAVAAVNPRVVVVLSNGSVVRVSPWEHHAQGLLECWLSGQAGGGAVADLLLGKANPSGRLAETIPVRLADNPSYLNFPGDSGQVRYGEGLFVGYRGYDASSREVSYPFGHGLSYTTFRYGDLALGVSGSHAGGDLDVAVSFTVTNTGALTGKEVAQVYVRDLDASVARPLRELRAFIKVEVMPGETRSVCLHLDGRAFSFWSLQHHAWVLESGEFEIAVGASSRALRLRAVADLEAPVLREQLSELSTLHEWLADPVGGPALRAALPSGPAGRAGKAEPALLADHETLQVVGGMPIGTLAAFPGDWFDGVDLGQLIAEVRSRS